VFSFRFDFICGLSGSVCPQGTDCIFTSDDVSVFATLSSANLADVRDEWERVKLSYEILSDPKTRKNYDRNSSVAEVLKDPGGAVGRAVVGGAMSGIGLVLGGAWKLGEMATKKVYETAVAEKEMRPTKPPINTNAWEYYSKGYSWRPKSDSCESHSKGYSSRSNNNARDYC
jgi:hypothetical protein